MARIEQRGRRDEQGPDDTGFSLIQQKFTRCTLHAFSCAGTENTAVNAHKDFSAILWGVYFVMSSEGRTRT